MTYVTATTVRRTIGIEADQINDTDIDAIIAEVEPQVERYYNTSFTPKERIDVLDGNGTIRIFVDQNPLLSVRELKVNGESESAANLLWYKESGKVELNTNASLSVTNFMLGSRKVVIKYIYGMVEESTTSTTTSSASTAGSSVVVSVSSSTGFTANDWVEIYGMDGNKEVAQVSATGTGTITVDKLVLSHESGSKVVKLQTSQVVKKLMNVMCALAMVARIVGQSYTDIVGYTLTEFQVQKGEPYTQWQETARQLMKEKEELMSRIKIRPYIAI